MRSEAELNKLIAEWRWGELDSFLEEDSDMYIKAGLEMVLDHAFTASLDSCFRHLVPKLQDENWKIRISLKPSACIPADPQVNLHRWESQYTRQNQPSISIHAETPALALCRAIEKLIDGGTDGSH